MSALAMSTTAARGLTIAWSEVNAHAKGTPLLLVHGNWSSRVWWEAAMLALPSSVRTIAYDLRGRGDTEGPDDDYAIDSLAADLVALVDALGIQDFHVAGHSLGSAVALQCALDHGDRVRSVAAVSAAWVDGMPPLFHQVAAQRALLDRDVLDRALRPLAPAAPRDDYWARCVTAGSRQRVVAAERNLDALTNWKPGDVLSTLAMPKVVISGALDALTGGRTAKRAAAAMNAPHVVFEGVGHCPPIEAPARTAAELSHFAMA